MDTEVLRSASLLPTIQTMLRAAALAGLLATSCGGSSANGDSVGVFGAGGTAGRSSEMSGEAAAPVQGGGGAGGGETGRTAGGVPVGGGKAACSVVPGPCTETSYVSATDSTVTTTYSYNDLGQLVRTEDDSQPAVVVRYSYDDKGRVVESRSDACDGLGAAGGFCIWYAYSYDEQGNLLVEDDKSNQPFVISGCKKFTYSTDGLRLSLSYYEWCSEGVDEYITYEYDPARRLVEEHNFGSDPAGASADTVYAYDAAGLLETVSSLDEAKNVTQTITYTRNSVGLPLVEEYHGTIINDMRVIYTYDAQGNVLTRKSVDLGGTTPGKESSCLVKTYDDCGNELTSDYDLDCVGVSTLRSNWSYACFEG